MSWFQTDLRRPPKLICGVNVRFAPRVKTDGFGEGVALSQEGKPRMVFGVVHIITIDPVLVIEAWARVGVWNRRSAIE